MGSVLGKLDVETRTVDLTMEAATLEQIDAGFKWLVNVRRWLLDQKRRDEGGSRWEFTRGTLPTAQYWRGSQKYSAEVSLVPVKIRTPRECTACGRPLKKGEPAWRQRSHTHTGHSHARFCDPCVERGHAPRPPKLVVLRGGKEIKRGD